MKRNIPLYVLTVALLAAAVYLKSPVIATAIVALWGVNAAEAILTRKNRDADIVEMQASLVSQKKTTDLLANDIRNVQERARVILGDNF